MSTTYKDFHQMTCPIFPNLIQCTKSIKIIIETQQCAIMPDDVAGFVFYNHRGKLKSAKFTLVISGDAKLNNLIMDNKQTTTEFQLMVSGSIRDGFHELSLPGDPVHFNFVTTSQRFYERFK